MVLPFFFVWFHFLFSLSISIVSQPRIHLGVIINKLSPMEEGAHTGQTAQFQAQELLLNHKYGGMSLTVTASFVQLVCLNSEL